MPLPEWGASPERSTVPAAVSSQAWQPRSSTDTAAPGSIFLHRRTLFDRLRWGSRARAPGPVARSRSRKRRELCPRELSQFLLQPGKGVGLVVDLGPGDLYSGSLHYTARRMLMETPCPSPPPCPLSQCSVSEDTLHQLLWGREEGLGQAPSAPAGCSWPPLLSPSTAVPLSSLGSQLFC